MTIAASTKPRRFARHLAEMSLAMLIGMLAFATLVDDVNASG